MNGLNQTLHVRNGSAGMDHASALQLPDPCVAVVAVFRLPDPRVLLVFAGDVLNDVHNAFPVEQPAREHTAVATASATVSAD